MARVTPIPDDVLADISLVEHRVYCIDNTRYVLISDLVTEVANLRAEIARLKAGRVVAEAVMQDFDVCDDERRTTVIIDALKDRRPDLAALDGRRVRVVVEEIP